VRETGSGGPEHPGKTAVSEGFAVAVRCTYTRFSITPPRPGSFIGNPRPGNSSRGDKIFNSRWPGRVAAPTLTAISS